MVKELDTLKQPSNTRGKEPVSINLWESRVEHALKNLYDRDILNRNTLSRIPYINDFAERQYSTHVLPRGLALRDILLDCVENVIADLHDDVAMEKACIYLDLLSKGYSCNEISRQLALSREHVSRVYRKKAIMLVTEEFQSLVKNVRSLR